MKIYLICVVNSCGECAMGFSEILDGAATREGAEGKLNAILAKSNEYLQKMEVHVIECKRIIVEYLNNNLDVIDGWHRTGRLTKEEKTGVINFLANNFCYSYGENILSDDNNMIKNYCDVKRLKKPYPSLPNHIGYPTTPIYSEDDLIIKEMEID